MSELPKITSYSPYGVAPSSRVKPSAQPLSGLETVAPLRGGDTVELSSLAAKKDPAPISQEDMNRYVQMLKDMAPVNKGDLEGAISRLERGDHGDEALKSTVDGLMEDLGFNG